MLKKILVLVLFLPAIAYCQWDFGVNNVADTTNGGLTLPGILYSQGIRFNTGATGAAGDTAPTLGYGADGTYDTGIYERAANELWFTVGGARQLQLKSTGLFATAGARAPRMVNTVTSETVPGWSFQHTNKIGIGSGTDSTMSAIVTNQEIVRYKYANGAKTALVKGGLSVGGGDVVVKYSKIGTYWSVIIGTDTLYLDTSTANDSTAGIE